MDQLPISEFRRLLTPGSTPCVSIYLPTTPGGIDSRGDKLRLKNALKTAHSQLNERQQAETDTKAVLAPGTELLENDAFWPNAQRGLAIWLSPTEQYVFKSSEAFREYVTVGERFHVRPLVPCLSRQVAGFVLGLSRENVRLFRVNGCDCELLSVPDLPSNLRDALNEVSVDRGAQSHSIGKSMKRKQTTVFHAQGAGHDTEKQDLSEYCRKVAKAVDDYLTREHLPLVLACVESLAPLYRKANNYLHLLPGIIAGSPDYLTDQEIVQKALPKLRSYVFRGVATDLARFKDMQGSDRATSDTAHIVRSAIDGHVDELFFDDRRDVWGRYEQADEIVDVYDATEPIGDDLIEVAVVETLRHRGRVHAVGGDQMPSATPMSAILRKVSAVTTTAARET